MILVADRYLLGPLTSCQLSVWSQRRSRIPPSGVVCAIPFWPWGECWSACTSALFCCCFITSPTTSRSTLSSRWYSSLSSVQDSHEVSSRSNPCHCTKASNSGPSLEEAHLVANMTRGVITGSLSTELLGRLSTGMGITEAY